MVTCTFQSTPLGAGARTVVMSSPDRALISMEGVLMNKKSGEALTESASAPIGPCVIQRIPRVRASTAQVVATCSLLLGLISAPVMNHVRRSGAMFMKPSAAT